MTNRYSPQTANEAAERMAEHAGALVGKSYAQGLDEWIMTLPDRLVAALAGGEQTANEAWGGCFNCEQPLGQLHTLRCELSGDVVPGNGSEFAAKVVLTRDMLKHPANRAAVDAAFAASGVPPEALDAELSKPCTEGGEYCFCVEAPTVVGPVANFCCWCNEQKSLRQPVPGHGKFRTELVRE